MKRILFLTLTVCMLLALCSCGEPPTVNSEFSAAFTATKDECGYSGAVTKTSDGLSVTMSEPYTVKGMTFEYSGSKLHIRCGGGSTNANSDYLPADSLPSALNNTLTYLSQAEYNSSENGVDNFTLPTPYGEARLSAVKGIPKSLTDPHSGIEFSFTEAE